MDTKHLEKLAKSLKEHLKTRVKKWDIHQRTDFVGGKGVSFSRFGHDEEASRLFVCAIVLGGLFGKEAAVSGGLLLVKCCPQPTSSSESPRGRRRRRGFSNVPL